MTLFRENGGGCRRSYLSRRKLGDFLEEEVRENLREIMESVEATKGSFFELVFDPTLVRGSPIIPDRFLRLPCLNLEESCGGGGRYDKMVGRFTERCFPALRFFPIGFEEDYPAAYGERLQNVPFQSEKTAYLVEKGLPAEELGTVIAGPRRSAKGRPGSGGAHEQEQEIPERSSLQKEGYTPVFRSFFAGSD